MNHRKFQLLACLITAALLTALSCKKETGRTDDGKKTDSTVLPPKNVPEDTISRKWRVDSAVHNGGPDASSKGLKIDIRKDGSYTLVSTSYIGTWEFIDNKTKVLLDKNEPAYKTTWTIHELTAVRMEVSFISPFTGGQSYWKLVPY